MNSTFLTYSGPFTPTRTWRATALVFEDPVSLRLLERIGQLAALDIPVLIVGESGTGKELAARHLHRLSAREARPFVAASCGAWTEGQIDAELFGTGATPPARKGWLEAADGGTLFLDEITELPPAAQEKLLRVLRERVLPRPGARAPRSLNVRLIAGTDTGLEAAVAGRKLREDLFYLFQGNTLVLPPLRERPGDILPLTAHFLREHSRRMGYGDVTLSDDASRALLRHPWPGNIRELENTIRNALSVCSSAVIRPDDLRLNAGAGAATRPESRPAALPPDVTLDSVLRALFESAGDAALARIDDAVLRAAFHYSGKNLGRAAALLGQDRDLLRIKLARLGESCADDANHGVRPPG